MQQGNITSINWNANSFFSGYVSNDDIYTYTGEVIGVNLKKYNEVKTALEKCKKRLIELGEIKLPKTPEELMKEQSDLINKQAKMIDKLMEQLNEHRENTELPTTECTNESTTSNTTSVPDDRPIDNKDERGRSKCTKE